MPHLIIDQPDHVLVALPFGKLSKENRRKRIRPQDNVNCVLFSLRRISFFSLPFNEKNYQAYEALEKALSTAFPRDQQGQYINNTDAEFQKLIKVGEDICNTVGINYEEKVLQNPVFHFEYEKFMAKYGHLTPSMTCKEFFHFSQPSKKWGFLYETIVKEIFFPLFHIQQSSWNPSHGFNGLMDSLRQHGAHVFLGKFGFGYHKQLNRFPSEDTADRNVYTFVKNSYKGDDTPMFHAVVVDQVKIIGGIPMVFFRDPMDDSTAARPEKVYMLTYDSFVKRLFNFYGDRYSINERLPTETFGMTSETPDELTKAHSPESSYLILRP